MEANGMVAIVQGLQDCALAVTVVNKQQFSNALRSNSWNAGSSSTSPRAIEAPDRGPVNNSSQITDGHYTSTYQVAHCNAKPTSPQNYVSEFPPQRLERCPNQGNFQIGTGEYSMASETPRARNLSFNEPSSQLGCNWLNDRSAIASNCLSPTRQYEAPGRITDVESGRLSPTGHISPAGRKSPTGHMSRSRRLSPPGRLSGLGWSSPPVTGPADSDQFANTLRRYPLASTDQYCPSELVQKFLTYTQNKNLSKMSMRRNRSPNESPTRDGSTKNIQTYTRNNNEPTKDPGPTTTKIHSNKSHKGNKGVKLPVTNSNSPKRSTSPKKSTSPKRSISSKRSISPERSTTPKRSASPNTVNSPDTSTTPCGSITPYNIRNSTYDYLKPGRGKKVEVRYLDDVRKCIRDTLKQVYEDEPRDRLEAEPHAHCSQVLEDVKKVIRDTVKQMYEDPPSMTCPSVRSRYNRHRRMFHDDTDKGSGTEAEDIKKIERGQETERYPKRNDFFPYKAPVPQSSGRVPKACRCPKTRWPCNCPEPRKVSEEVNLGVKIAEETFNWVKGLPVYANEVREDKVKREAMIMDLVKNLQRMIGDLDFENNARKLIKECIEQLPIWYPEGKKDQETFKNQITDELVDKLNNIVDKMTDIVSKWINKLEFTDTIDKGEVVNNIVKRLKPLANEPEEMETEIKDMLQDLPILNKTKVIENISGKLVDDLQSVAADIALKKEIKKWLDNTPELSNGENNTKDSNKLAKNIQQALDQELDVSNYQEVVRKVVDDWIEDITNSCENKLGTRTKANLADQLVNKLKIQEKLKPARRVRSLANRKDYMDITWNWLKNNDVIPEANRKKYQDPVNNLAKKLLGLQSNGAGDHETAKEIINFLDYFIGEGEAIVNKGKLAKKLVEDLKIINVQPSSLKRYDDRTSEWLTDNVKIPKENREKYKGPVKDLAKNLQKLQSRGAGEDEIAEEIGNFLDFLTEEGETVVNKDKLAKTLIANLNKTDEKPTSLKQYEDRTSKWLSDDVDIPEENREKYKGPIKDFTKKLQKLQAKGATEDEITEEIIKFLNYFTEKGETIVNKDKLAKKLVKDLKRNSEQPSSLQQYEDLTSEWLTDVVDIPEENREKYKGPVEDFNKKLRKLQSRGAGEDEIKKEIGNFLNFLTEEGETVVNKDKLAKTLIANLNKADEKPTSLKQYEDRTSKWLSDDVDIPEENREKYKGPIKDFTKKLQKLQAKGATEDEITEEIIKFLNYFTEKGETIVNKDKLAKKLVKDLRRNSEQPSSLQQYEDRTSEWLTDIVDIPEENREKYKGPVEDFNKKLRKLQSRGAGEDEIKKEIGNFLDFLTEEGETVVNKDKLAKTLIANLNKTDEKPTSLKQYEDRTSKWLSDDVDIPEENREKYKGPIKDFTKKLQKLQAKGATEDEITEEIIKFLNYFTEKGETIVNKDKLAKKLVKDLKRNSEQPSSLQQYEDRTSEWLTDIVDIPEENREKYKGPVEDFNKKLRKLQSRGAGEDEIKEEIGNFLDFLTEEGETVVNKDKLAKTLIANLNKTDEKPTSLKQYEDRTSKWLSDDVDIPEENREKYKGPIKDFTKKLQKLQAKGATEDEITEEIIKFLNYFTEKGETIVNKDKLAKKLVKDLKRNSEQPSSLQQYEDRTSEWLTDIVDIPEENREKYKGPVEDFNKKLRKLQSRGAGEDEIKEEIGNFLDFLTEEGETVVNKDKLAKTLIANLNKTDEKPTSLKQYEDRTSKWLSDDVDIPEENREKYKGPIKDFTKKLQKLQAKGATEDEITEEIIKFLNYFTEKGETIVNKDKLAKKLVKDLKRNSEQPSSLQQYEDCTSEWLTDVVDIPEENREKYKGPVEDFNKKLRKLQSRGAGEDEIKKEIGNFLDFLTEEGETVVNKDKLAKTLIANLNKADEKPTSLKQYEDRTSKWLSDDVDIPEENREKYKGPIKDFTKKLQKLQAKGATEDEITEEIIKFLNYFTEKGETIVNKDKLAKKLVKDLKRNSEQPSSLQQYEDCTSEWLTDVVDIPEENREKYKGPVEDFNKKLRKLQSRGAGEDEIKEEIGNFLDFLTEEGETVVNKDKLAKTLIANLNKTDEKPTSLKQYEDRTSKWLSDDVDIPEENREKYKGPIKDFTKKLQKLQAKGATEDEITEEIIKFLNYFTEKGETIVNKDKLAKKLVKDLKRNSEQPSSLQQYEDCTSEWLTDVVDIPEENREKYKGPVEDFNKKLRKLQSRGAGEDEIKEEIGNFLDFLTEEGETVVNKDKLAKTLIANLNKTDEKPTSLKEYEDRTSKWLSDDVDIPEENREKYKGPIKDFTKKLQKLQAKGATEDEITEEIIKFLNYFTEKGETIVNKDNLAKKLVKDLKRNSEQPSSLQQYEDCTSEWLTDVVDIPEENREKYKGPVEDFNKKLRKLQSRGAGEDEIKKEIGNFLDFLTEEGETVVNKDKLAKTLIANLNKADEKPTSLKQYEDRTSKWLSDDVDIPEENREKYKGPIKDFTKKLQKLQAKGATEDEITEEIIKFLNYFTEKGETIVNKDKLAKKLVKDLKRNSEQPSSLQQYEDLTSEWLTDVVDIPEENREKYKGPVEDFNKKLRKLQSRGAGEDEIKKEIGNFLDFLTEEGETVVNKDKLAKTLIANLNKTDEKPTSLKQYEDRTSKWLSDDVDIPEENREKYKGPIKDFTKKLQKLQAKGATEDEITEEIIKFLNYFTEKGETIVNKDKLAKKLVKDLKRNSEQPSSLQQYEDRTSEWLTDIVDIPEENREKYKGPVEDFNKKLRKLQSRGAGEDEIKEEIGNFLDFLTEEGETVVNKDKLAKTLIANLNKTDEKPTSLKQYEDRTSKWLSDDVDIPEENREKYKGPIKDFTKKLQKLQAKGATEDEITEEIIKFLNYFTEKGETIVNKDKLAKKLVKDLKRNSEQPSSLQQYEDCTSEWLTDVVDIPEENREKYKGPVEDFNKKLRKLQSRGAGEDEIKEEIGNFLDFLTEEGETVVNKDKLAKTLIANLNKTDEKPTSLKEYEDRTSKWLSDDVDIPEENREKYKGPIKDFTKKLQKLQAKGATEDEITEEIIKFLNYFTEKGETIVNKDKLAKKLVKDLKRNSEQPSSLQQYDDRTSEWLTDVVDIPEEKSMGEQNKDGPKSKKRIPKKEMKFSKKKGQAGKSSGTAGDETTREKLAKNRLKDNITTFRKLSPKDHENRDHEWLTEKVKSKKSKGDNSLDKKMQGSSRTSDDETTDEESGVKKKKTAKNLSKDPKLTSNILGVHRKQSILKEISDLIEDIPSNSSKSNQKELKNDIADILTQNFNNLPDKSYKAHQDIKNLLMKAAKMSDEDASKIASAIINKVNSMPILKSSTDQKRYSQRIDQDNIHDVMKEFDIHPNLKTGLLKSLTDFFTDVDASTVPTEIKKHDLSIILQNAGLSANDANDMAEMLLTNKKLTLRTKDSVVLTKRRSTVGSRELSPMQRENFVEIAEKEISDFVNDLKKDDSPEARKVIEEKLSKLAENLGEIISDPIVKDKKKAVLGLILDFFKDIPLKTNTPTAELAKLLADRILNIGFQTSTPNTQGFLPNKPSFDNSSTNYAQDSIENPQAQYMNQLMDNIQAWVEKVMPKKVSRTLKNKMIRELAADMFDRQKYLQFHPEAKTSNEEELARLKYEVYRMINQTLNSDDLSLVIQKVDDLMKQIEKLKIPNLVTTTEKVTSQKSKDAAGRSTFTPTQDSNEFIKENLKGGVHDWLKSLPLYQRRNSTDKRKLEKMIPRLVSAIMSVIENAPTAVEADKHFIEEIVKQLKKSAIEPELKSDETFLRNTAAALLENLNEFQLFQDISDRQETITDPDPLQAILNDWVGSLPIKRMNSSEVMKFEKLKKNFASKLEQMRKKYPNDDEKIKKTIQQNLLSFPIEESTKRNQKLMNDEVENLFRHLLIVPIKESEYKSKVSNKAADILFDNIEDWCEKLPFKSTFPQAKQEIAKKEIACKLINKIAELNLNPEVLNDEFLYSQLFEDELDNLLADIFSGDDKKNLATLKNNVLEKVKEARQNTLEEIAGQTYKHKLRNTISENLPFQTLSAEERADFEAVKDALVDDFINLHYVGDNKEQKQKYKTDIKKELTKFCDDYLQNHENMPLDTAKLNENVYQALKSIPIPKDETLIPEVELAKVKEYVNKWVKELPLRMQAGDEKLKVDKLAAVLAKKIHDIEKKNELEDNTDFSDLLMKAILQWMDKLPEHLDENIKNKFASKLVDNLDKTRETRKVSADMRRSIDEELSDGTLNKNLSCKEYCRVPCSTLTREDAMYLETIRARAKSTQLKHTGSQTTAPSCEKLDHITQEAGSLAEVAPRLIVKEYYWDTATSQFVESYSPCSREYPPCSPISSPCSPISSPCSPVALPRPSISRFSPIASPHSLISPSGSMNSPIWSPTPGSCLMPHQLFSPPCSNPPLGSQKHTALSQRRLETDHCRSDNIPASYQHQAGYEQSPSPVPDLSQRRPSRRLPDNHESCSPCPFGMTESSLGIPSASYPRAEISSEERHVPNHCRGHCIKSMLGVDDKRPSRKFCRDRPCLRQRLDDDVRAQPHRKRTKSKGFSCCNGASNARDRNEEMESCSKCCGVHCPFPSYMYFK